MNIFVLKGKSILVASVTSWQVLEQRLGCKASDTLPSGMAAIINPNFALLEPSTLKNALNQKPPFALIGGEASGDTGGEAGGDTKDHKEVAVAVVEDASAFETFEGFAKIPPNSMPLPEGQNYSLAKPSQRAFIEHQLQQALAKHHCENVFFNNIHTVRLGWDTKFGSNVEVGNNVWFGGDVVVEDNVTIRSFCHLENCTIGKNAVVGPFAHLRTGTVLEDGALVGAFAEVKNSTIGSKSKIPHLSYVGDAQIGSGVNVGAGTIFCNYDGTKKNHTKIGANAFIGSNNSLVAPLTLGKNVSTAAGSTITEDIKDDSFAIARSPQITKKSNKSNQKQ